MLSRPAAAFLLVVAVSSPLRVDAQESKTAALVKELIALLDGAKTDCGAGRVIGSTDEFVAVMHFPGAQLLAIEARYAAPPLLNERLIQRNFKEVYLDLNAATNPADRVVIEDLQANGLRFKPAQDEPADYYSKGTAARFAFDGQWKKQKISADEYSKKFEEADARYARMLESVIAEFKKGS